MEEVLIREYGRKHELGQKTTYLDMTQKICGKVLKACQAVPILEVDDEVLITVVMCKFWDA